MRFYVLYPQNLQKEAGAQPYANTKVERKLVHQAVLCRKKQDKQKVGAAQQQGDSRFAARAVPLVPDIGRKPYAQACHSPDAGPSGPETGKQQKYGGEHKRRHTGLPVQLPAVTPPALCRCGPLCRPIGTAFCPFQKYHFGWRSLI